MKNLITLTNLKDLKLLRDLYSDDSPANAIAHATLDNYIRWLQRDPNLRHIKVYTLPETWRHSGLFLLVDRYHLMLNTASTTPAAAVELCVALQQLDWTYGYKIMCVPDAHFKVVLATLEALKLHCLVIDLQVRRMRREQALTLDTSYSTEFVTRPLTEADASIVNELWYSRHPGTLEFIKRLIRFNCNIGICTQNNNELVAWCIRCQCGLLGMLHVKEAWRGRGLAKLATNAVARQVAVLGDDAYAMIGNRNMSSQSLFEKLNFELVAQTYIIHAKPVPNADLWSAEQEDCIH